MAYQYENMPVFPALGSAGKKPLRFMKQAPVVGTKLNVGQPANPLAAKYGFISYADIGGGEGYTSGQWTVTASGTGAAVAQDDKYDGLKMTTGSATNFYAGIQSICGSALGPVADKEYTFSVMAEVSDVTKLGFWIGFSTTSTDPSGTEPTNYVAFVKTNTTAPVVTKVRGNSGTTATGTASYTSVNNTLFEVGARFILNATTPQGEWYIGTPGNTTVYPMTSAELTQLAAILTGAPSSWRFSIIPLGTTGANYALRPKAASAHRVL